MTRIALLLFPEITQLDLTGPYEVFCRMPDVKVDLVWKDRGPVRTEHGLHLQASQRFDEVSTVDVLCVPGGFGVNALLTDPETLSFVRRVAASARYVTSVCSGALILGAAGLLKGKRATTHWAATQYLADFGAIETKGRLVRDGTLITGGGVTAGIDLALQVAAELHGQDCAEAIQLMIEYNPAPPFDAGHPERARPELVNQIRSNLAEAQKRRQQQIKAALAATN